MAPSLSKHAYNLFDLAVNPTTEIRYAIAQEIDVELVVFDALGQRVKILVQRRLPAGNYAVVWDGTNQAGQPVGSGIYFYRLLWEQYHETKKMILLRLKKPRKPEKIWILHWMKNRLL